ncbi:MAG: hemolysin III family protein [Desulfosalsimonadaceae bacterium]
MSRKTQAYPAPPAPSRRYTTGEEIANTVTHGIGALLSVAALVTLLLLARENGDLWRIAGFTIYGISLFTLYLASSLYHAVTGEKLKKIFRMLDHSSIYLLIAGTYTPILLIAMRGTWGWTLFVLIWTMAAAGLVYKFIFLDRSEWVSLAIYIAMGWLAIIAIKPMLAMLPAGLLLWIVFGGLLYTGGIVFYVWKRIPFNHAIWHLFVLGGSTLHFVGILLYLTPIA